MKRVEGVVSVQNKKYPYSLTEKKNDVVFVEWKAANVAQDFLKEDVANLLIDLPSLIVAEKQYQATQSNVVRFRITPAAKKQIEKKAVESGFKSVSEYMRHLALSS